MVALLDFFFFLSADAARIVGGFDHKNVAFDQNYNVTWGNHHAQLLNQGKEVQLSLDQSSGVLYILLSLSPFYIFRFHVFTI